MRFKNYRNKYNNQNRIYSEDDVFDMTLGSIFDNENDLLAQNREIGVPSVEELRNSPNAVWIEAYTRDDGTEVRGHWRSLPDEGSMTGAASNVNYLKNKAGNKINDFFDKAFNIKTDHNIPQTKWEKVQENIAEHPIINKILPMASNDVIDAMHDFKAAKNNPHATVINSLKELNNTKLEAFFIRQKADKNTPVVIYNSESDESKAFSNSPQIDAFITQYYYQFVDGTFNRQGEYEIEFKPGNKLNDLERLDKYLFLQHVTITDAYIDNNGFFHCKLLDYADFDLRPDIETKEDVIKKVPNNWGFNMQQKELYKNHAIIINIKRRIY